MVSCEGFGRRRWWNNLDNILAFAGETEENYRKASEVTAPRSKFELSTSRRALRLDQPDRCLKLGDTPLESREFIRELNFK
jgi:hypothetical protein